MRSIGVVYLPSELNSFRTAVVLKIFFLLKQSARFPPTWAVIMITTYGRADTNPACQTYTVISINSKYRELPVMHYY